MNIYYNDNQEATPNQVLETSMRKMLKTFLPEKSADLYLLEEKDLKEKIVIDVAKDFKVLGKDEKSLFQGVMYLIRLLTKDPEFKGSVELQVPAQKNILMIDMARKFYSLKALKQLVEEMALFQFDFLQLHFSENEGFRIESKKYPEIVSKHFLTTEEVQELILYANSHYIEIIPDFDSPGHLKHILKLHPEWALQMYNDNHELVSSEKALDILNEEAVNYIHSIYEEYAELFSNSHFFHIGSDEFVPFDEIEKYPTLLAEAQKRYGKDSSGIELFIEYTNQTAALIRELGFYPLVWNDGFYRNNRTEQVHLTKDCLVSYWTRWDKHMATVQDYLEKGYNLINHNDNFFYYVLGEHASYTYPSYEKIIENWKPVNFPQQQVVKEEDLKQVKGNAIAIWSDIPDAKTEEEVMEDVFYIIAALSEKTWKVTPFGKENIEKIFKKLVKK